MSKIGYRPEIDGLRAIAVIPVVLFHSGYELFSGGYIGVDIFFVISGYLITSILLNELERSEFSVLKFYERRARRILPALFVVIAFSSIFAWQMMTPSQLKDYGQSLIGVGLFVSNILFAIESGYFDSEAEEKPLLHTWSLAVEEQYYLFFPLFLLVAWRLGYKNIAFLITMAAVGSFALSAHAIQTSPTNNFFLAQYRVWEILIGSLSAIYINRKGVVDRPVMSLLGVFALMTPIFIYDSSTPFPSYYTLLPVLGTAAIIMFTNKGLIGSFLKLKPLVFIGLISYSLYLWHQPVLAFDRISNVGDEDVLRPIFLLIFITFLSIISWKYIEAPFRNRGIKRNTIFGLSLLALAMIVGAGLLMHFYKGYPQRLPIEQQQYLQFFENSLPNWNYFQRIDRQKKMRSECNFYNVEAWRVGNATIRPIRINESCYQGDDLSKESILIWGDSHAQHLNFGFDKVLGEKFNVLQVASSGCDLKLQLVDDDINYCNKSNYTALEKIKLQNVEYVVLAQNENHDVSEILKITDALLSVGVKKVIFFGPTPHWNPHLPQLISKLLPKPPNYLSKGLIHRFLELDEQLHEAFKDKEGITYFSIINEFCNKDGCLAYLNEDPKNEITSYDYGHLTPEASVWLLERFALNESIRNDLLKNIEIEK